MIEHRRSFTDANEHEYCGPLLWPESRVAFIYKADRASGIERVGIENLLILLATRATGRLITGPCENLDRRTVGTRESGGARRGHQTGPEPGERGGRTHKRSTAARRGSREGRGTAGRRGRRARAGCTCAPGQCEGRGHPGTTGAPASRGCTRLSLGWWLALPARSQEKDG